MDQAYRPSFAAATALCVVVPLLLAAASAKADDPLPVIVTYELHKSHTDAAAVARAPRRFWISQIVGRIEDKKPMLKLSLKQPVTVAVSFVVGRDGKLVSSSIEKSSGDPAIDKQAVAALESAAPFPPMPAALGDDTMAFTVPLRFK